VKVKSLWPFVVFLLSVFYLFPDGGNVLDFGTAIPKKIGTWEAAEEDHLYNRETLYDYMDGGAEVYLAFDFQQVWARKYTNPAGLELRLDIYDMGSPEEAFGIFSCDREDPSAGIGQDSEYGFGLLRFRQGRYFVTITASDENEGVGKSILDLGRAVAERLGPPGPKPDLIEFLPPDSIRPDRTSYFHSSINLNNRFFVASENILHLDRSTDCDFAEYDAAPGEVGYLLLIRYPEAERAASARQSFLASYVPEAGADGLAQTENKKWVSAFLHENFLAVVFEAPTAEWARKIVSSIKFPKK
jgi:hypothetical protein